MWSSILLRVKEGAFRHPLTHVELYEAQCMSRCDGGIVFDAPDDATATTVIMERCSKGNVDSETLRVFTEDEIEGVLEKIT